MTGAKSGVISALYHFLISDETGMMPDTVASSVGAAVVDISNQLVTTFECVPEDTTSCTQYQWLWNLMDVSLLSLAGIEDPYDLCDILGLPDIVCHSILDQLIPHGLNLQYFAQYIVDHPNDDFGELIRQILNSGSVLDIPAIMKNLIGE